MTQTSKNLRGRPAQPPATPRLAAATVAPLDSLLDPDLFKALCDPTRARIALCLCKCSRPCAVTEIAECCSVDLSVVSRHLAQLERHGVLESTKQGRTVLYRVRYRALVHSFRALADAIEVCWRACGQGCGDPGSSCCGPEACGAASQVRSTASARPRDRGGSHAN